MWNSVNNDILSKVLSSKNLSEVLLISCLKHFENIFILKNVTADLTNCVQGDICKVIQIDIFNYCWHDFHMILDLMKIFITSSENICFKIRLLPPDMYFITPSASTWQTLNFPQILYSIIILLIESLKNFSYIYLIFHCSS